MSDLLIRNCNVLNITIDQRAFILRDHDILIHGNRIESVQPTGQADPSHFKHVIEANGQLAMPGLINTHAHVPMVIFRGLAEDVTIEKWFNDYMWPLERLHVAAGEQSATRRCLLGHAIGAGGDDPRRCDRRC